MSNKILTEGKKSNWKIDSKYILDRAKTLFKTDQNLRAKELFFSPVVEIEEENTLTEGIKTDNKPKSSNSSKSQILKKKLDQGANEKSRSENDENNQDNSNKKNLSEGVFDQKGEINSSSVTIKQDKKNDATNIEKDINRNEVEKEKEVLFKLSDLEQARNEGYKQGIEEGFLKGNESGKKETIEKYEEKFSKRIEKLDVLFDEIEKNINLNNLIYEPLKRLALNLSNTLVRKELSLSSEIVENLINNCLTVLDSEEYDLLKIYLNSEDYDLIRGKLKRQFKKIDLKEMKELSRGSVLVKLNDTVIEDFFERRLNDIKHSFLDKESIEKFDKDLETFKNYEKSKVSSKNQNKINNDQNLVEKNENDFRALKVDDKLKSEPHADESLGEKEVNVGDSETQSSMTSEELKSEPHADESLDEKEVNEGDLETQSSVINEESKAQTNVLNDNEKNKKSINDLNMESPDIERQKELQNKTKDSLNE